MQPIIPLKTHQFLSVNFVISILLISGFSFLTPVTSYAQTCVSGDCVDGVGVYEWENGAVAEGVWVDGFLVEGKLVTHEDFIYEGSFKEYKLIGKGKKTWPEGYSVYGKWKDEEVTGKLLIIWESGVVVEGKFEDARLTGKGVVTLVDETVYKGKFSEGVLQLSENEAVDQWGTIFSGEFVNGVFVNGMISYSSGTIDKGAFVDGKLSGEGLVEWGEGDFYEGVFDDGELVDGIKIFTTGITLEGTYKENEIYGYGTKTLANEFILEGLFLDGVPNGYGVITFVNGDVYEGDWKKGILKYSEDLAVNHYGTMFNGIWVEDEFVSGIKSFIGGDYQQGKFKGYLMYGYGLRYEDGLLFDGEWEEGVFSGHGTITNEYGIHISGTFSDYLINGPGTIVISENEEYSGNWRHGWLWLDEETMLHQSGQRKVGVFKGTELVSGIFYYADGSYEEGEFEDGYLHGEGEEYSTAGFTLTGTFYHGYFVKGRLVRENGVVCEGEFWGASLNGEGSMQMPNDGEYFSGTWDDGILSIGDSLLVGDQGRIARGELNQELLPHGNATMISTDYVQTGIFSSGYLVTGTQVYTDGTTLTGDWEGEEFVSGTRVWSSGEINEGTFLNENLIGFGTLTFPDGRVFEGDWVEGFLTISDRVKYAQYGAKLTGEFDDFGNSEYLEVIISSGTSLYGKWIDFEMVEGIKTSVFGLVMEGAFTSGFIDGLSTKSVPARDIIIAGNWVQGCRSPNDNTSSELIDEFTEVRIHGFISEMHSDFSIDGAVLEVYKDGELFDITFHDETFSLYLPGPGKYNIVISHDDYLPKTFTFDLSDITPGLLDFITHDMHIGLYSMVEGFNMDLLSEPISINIFNKETDEIITDVEYYEIRKTLVVTELKRLGVDVGQ